jgi:DNA polymerase elongation subunit (family B)
MYQNIFVKTSTNQAWIWDDVKGLLNFNYTPYAFKKDPNGTYKSLYGDKLSKVTKFIKNDPDLLESDVPETTRLLVDMYGESDIPSENIVTMTLDIEVEMITGTPDPAVGNNEITSIAYHDSVTNDYTILILDKDKKLEPKINGNKHIIPCYDEKTLLLKFLNGMEEIRPHIITGWNCDAFDIPYIFNRIKNILGVSNAYRLSPIKEMFFSPYRNRWVIAGISVLDYMVIYKKFSYQELPSYSLNYVSNKELGRGKIEYEGNLDDLMKNDIDTFIEYNITDVELIIELDKKLQYIDLVRGICHVGHVPYEDFIYSSKYLEGALLTYLRNIGGIVAPNKPADRKERMEQLKESGQQGFIGAFVKDPVAGRYEWIYDLDLTSLYPSIIMTLNISPETKVAKIDDWDFEDFIKNKRESYTINNEIISSETLKKFLEKYNYTVSSNGVMYSTDYIGLIPAILNEWFEKRVEYKDEMKKWGKLGDTPKYEFYKKRQLVQKILLNSLYGVLGLPAFRFYDIDNAEAVTLSGQTVIKKTQDVINLKYNKELKTDKIDYVQYVDTDSVFLSCLPLVKNRYPSIDTNNSIAMTEKIYEIATEVQDYVNNFYDVFCKKIFNTDKHRLEIKQEKIARTGFWTKKKKRYALWIISDNGVPTDELEVKGLDVVRSSFPKSFQVIMKEVLIDILKGKEKEYIDEKILDFKKKLNTLMYSEIAKNSSIKDIKKYQDLVKDDVLGKFSKGTPSHIKAAINYNKLLKLFKCPHKYAPIKNGDKIKIVYLKNNKFGLEELAFRGDQDPPEILSLIEDYLDYNELFLSELDAKIRSLYDSMTWEFPSESKKIAERFFSFI